MNSNCITLDQEHIRAADIFEDQIGNCATDALIEQLSVEFEAREKKALVRPWEEREDGSLAASYVKRKNAIEAERKKNPPEVLAYNCSPEIARAELARYERMTRREITQTVKVKVGDEEVEKQPIVEAIHTYQRILGLPLTDFTKPVPKVDAPNYEGQIKAYLEQPLVERRRIVEETQDREFLSHVQAADPELDLARRAQQRVFELSGLKG